MALGTYRIRPYLAPCPPVPLVPPCLSLSSSNFILSPVFSMSCCVPGGTCLLFSQSCYILCQALNLSLSLCSLDSSSPVTGSKP